MTSPYTPTGNITLYAQWTLINYTVSFNGEGGTGSLSPLTYNIVGGALTLPTTTRLGYTFNGWFTQASGGSPVTSSFTPTSSTQLYAQWTANTYVVTYDPQGGSLSSTSVTYSGASGPIQLALPTQDGYTFEGWYDMASGGNLIGNAGEHYTPVADITLYAEWVPAVYTVPDLSGLSANAAIDALTAAGFSVGTETPVTSGATAQNSNQVVPGSQSPAAGSVSSDLGASVDFSFYNYVAPDNSNNNNSNNNNSSNNNSNSNGGNPLANNGSPYGGALDIDLSQGSSGSNTTTSSANSVTLHWTIPVFSTGTVTGFAVRESVNSGASWNVIYSSTNSVASSYEVDNLMPGTDYSFEVAFYFTSNSGNAPELSNYSTVISVATLPAPSAPSNLQVTTNGQSATVSWTASGSSDVTGYEVLSSTGAVLCTTTTTSCQVSSLSPGAVTFSVVTLTSTGKSTPVLTTPVTVVAPAKVVVPSAPAIAATSKTVGTAVISVVKAPVAGTSQVTSYQVSLNGGKWATVSRLKNGTFVIKNLKSKTKYSVRIRAVSKSGPGAASAPVVVRVR